MIWQGNPAIKLFKSSFPSLQRSPGMKVNEWSSPIWSCSSASSSVTMSFPTTSTCARSFPEVTWLLTPTCRARAPPAMSPPMNQSARSRRQAAVARMRHVGGICCGVWWVIWLQQSKVTTRCEIITRGYRLFNRILVCQSRWKSIRTPVLILTRCIQHLTSSV